MKVTKSTLYVLFAIGGAVYYGLVVGPYWVDDAIVFAALASLVIWSFFSLKVNFRSKVQITVTEPRQREYIPRSRIAHYVSVSRIHFLGYLARESESPFERALLSEPEWQKLSGERLQEVSRKVIDASGNSAQN